MTSHRLIEQSLNPADQELFELVASEVRSVSSDSPEAFESRLVDILRRHRLTVHEGTSVTAVGDLRGQLISARIERPNLDYELDGWHRIERDLGRALTTFAQRVLAIQQRLPLTRTKA